MAGDPSNLDAGDRYHERGDTVAVASDGTGSAGDVVEWSGGQVTQGASAGAADAEAGFGVLAEDSPSAGEDVQVHVDGAVVTNADSGVTAGEVARSQTNAGSLESGAGEWYALYDEGENTSAGTTVVRIQ